MKNKISIYLVAISLAINLISCSKQQEVYHNENPLSSSKENFDAVQKMSLHNMDSIIQFNESDFPKKKQNKTMATSYASDDLYQLDGIEFKLKTINSYFSKNTLKTNGAGQALTLDLNNAITTDAHLFYFKFLPATSGIPYMIYSYKEKKPVGVGSYQNNPNTKIIYTKQNDIGSTFGFSWDLLSGTDNKGYIVQNNDIPFQGSGGWWDTYYGVITNNQGNLSLSRNSNSLYQQFNLIPNDEFNIISMTMDINNATITSSTPIIIDQKSIENPTNETGSRTITFSVTRQDNYSFKESSSVSYEYSANVTVGFKLFKILQVGTSFTFTEGNTQSLEYTNSNTKSVQLSDSYTIPVPPQTRSVCTFNAMKHIANVPYTATIKGVRTQKPITIHGYFEGVDYTTSNLRVDNYPLYGINKKAISTIYIEPNKK